MKTISRFPLFGMMAIILLALQSSGQITLNLKVYLEGPCNGTSMNTDLNVQNLIPLDQPYNTAPWNYTGTELVPAIPNSSVVDWVLIELRETTGDASTATPDKLIYRQAAFLKSDGQVVGLDGTGYPVYSGTVSANLYVIIRHRNHLAVMSSGPLTESSGVYSWDFTDQIAKAYLNGQKEIASAIFGMTGGDCNGSGTIIQNDKILTWEDRAGYYGYFSSDLNLDGQVDNDDKDWVYVPNIGQSAQLPEGIAWDCGMDFTDSRDGQIYSSVQISDQCWMADNLNIGTMINGIDYQSQQIPEIIEKYCYDNNTSNCDTYGGLYQWDETMQYTSQEGTQGICPAGWHVPSDAEFTALTDFLAGSDVAGGKMKTTGTIENSDGLWYAPNTGATNESGFSALPGSWNIEGDFFNLGYQAIFWSSTENDMYSAWYRSLHNYKTEAHRDTDSRIYGMSVRCIKNE